MLRNQIVKKKIKPSRTLNIELMRQELNSKRTKILLAIIFLSLNIFGQCPPDDKFYAITQETVDSFIIDYPNCTSLQKLDIGDLGPSTWEITDLSPFINLVHVEDLSILEITAESLEGLNNLKTVGRFSIYAMPKLTSLDGLEGLESVTGYKFRIGLCIAIINLNGLENLTNVNVTEFKIESNYILNDVEGLDCYFFTEEFRNTVPYYNVQESLYPSILEDCGIKLSNDDLTYKKIRVYPNPAKSFINIDHIEQIKQISIYDLSGRLIKYKNSDFEKIELSDISSGTYILKVSLLNNIIVSNKLIVE